MPSNPYLRNNKLNTLSIRNGNYIRHPSYFSVCNFIDTIELIYKIHQLINKPFIQKIILNILKDYSKHKHDSPILSKLTLQYINRFYYIYKKTQDFYNTDHHYTITNIFNIAITNLYILKKLQTKWGIYILIKYLYIND